MSRRGRRPLSREDLRLWAEVARSVLPLPGRLLDDLPDVPENAAEAPAGPLPAPPSPEPARAVASRPRPLVGLERRTARALARGQLRAAATLDLHGLTQAEAHARLIGFLRRSQAAGHGLVLVVTGRGGGTMQHENGRGVLRRTVPHWLGLPDLRSVVMGYEEAGTRQGGSGALYVRLRRPRG